MKVEDKIIQTTDQIKITANTLLSLAEFIGHHGVQSTLEDVILHLQSPFTFVIVGEVKAGKSSFINALLDQGTEICKVAPSPMTDTIQLLVYGDQVNETSINAYVKKISQPIPILKEISIVDTPGTNTIIAHHQEITERFIPHADLIVFVFEAKNPYRQSSWSFFDFVHNEWHRKTIFVLQQKDLLSEEDLHINIDGIKKILHDKGVASPLIYAVSAKLEQDKYTDISGFKALRAYIDKDITSGQAPIMKVKSNVETLRTIAIKLDESMDIRRQQFHLDKTFRHEVQTIIEDQHQKTKQQIKFLSSSLLDTYDAITLRKSHDLESGLSLISVLRRSLSSIFGKDTGLKDWLNSQAKDLELQLNTQLKDKLNNGILDVAENIQTMGKLVDNKLRYSQTILKNNDEIFADIAEKRINVLKDLQQSFQSFMNNAENFYDQSLISEGSKMTPNLAAGGGIAVVGVILAALANGVVFDITGGILTAIGVLFAGITLGLNRSKVIAKFKEEVSKGRQTVGTEIDNKLGDYSERIKFKMEQNFHEFDTLLVKEEDIISRVNREIAEANQQLDDTIHYLDNH